MENVQRVSDLGQIRLLADGRRLAILQRLMAGPATLTQLGQAFGKHPAWIRHHIKQLEKAGLVHLHSTRPVYGVVEKYYCASASAYAISALVAPASPAASDLVALGSHDLALEQLASDLLRQRAAHLWALPLGSLDGLIALRQGACHIAGCHLLDVDSGDYNLPYVTRLFPGQSMALITLAYRQQGLLLAPGNPRRIRDLADLARPDVVFANRNPGSGTRLWLDQALRRLSITGSEVRGYSRELATHTEVAASVAAGQADCGLAIFAAARRLGLSFLPLFWERYELVVTEEELSSPPLQAVINEMQSASFRAALSRLGGYDGAQTGTVRRLVA